MIRAIRECFQFTCFSRGRVWCVLDNLNHLLPERFQVEWICNRHDQWITSNGLSSLFGLGQWITRNEDDE